MSGFLKFIVHLVVFLAIISILALAVPPFMGISTVTIDDADIETNLPLGSVTYGKSISGRDVLIGDSIIVQDGNQIYRYRVQEIDLDNSMYTVLDASQPSAGPKAITLRGDITRVTITIGFLGYLLMAIQSTEGLVIIGLGVLFLIVLFVLAELWSKDKDAPGEEEEAQDDLAAAKEAIQASAADQEPKSRRQLKKEMRARQKAEVARLKAEAKERRREEKQKLKEAKKIARTGGFIEDMEPVETILGLEGGSPAEQAADQAHEELKKEIEAAVPAQTQSAEPEKSPTAEIPSLKAAKEEAPAAKEELQQPQEAQVPQTAVSENEEPDEAAQEKELTKIAIPLYTAEELLEKAKAAGEAPKVIQDEDTGVTLLDYSTIIGGKSREQDEEEYTGSDS